MSKEENIKDLVLIQLNEDMACIKERIEEYIQGFNSYTFEEKLMFGQGIMTCVDNARYTLFILERVNLFYKQEKDKLANIIKKELLDLNSMISIVL